MDLFFFLDLKVILKYIEDNVYCINLVSIIFIENKGRF
jgi:hypothetical protein